MFQRPVMFFITTGVPYTTSVNNFPVIHPAIWSIKRNTVNREPTMAGTIMPGTFMVPGFIFPSAFDLAKEELAVSKVPTPLPDIEPSPLVIVFALSAYNNLSTGIIDDCTNIYHLS